MIYLSGSIWYRICSFWWRLIQPRNDKTGIFLYNQYIFTWKDNKKISKDNEKISVSGFTLSRKAEPQLWHFLSFRSLPWVICVLKVYACHPCECVKLRHVAGLFWTHDDDCLLPDSSLIKFLRLSLCWWVIQRHVPKAISFIRVNPLISVFFKTPDPWSCFESLRYPRILVLHMSDHQRSERLKLLFKTIQEVTNNIFTNSMLTCILKKPNSWKSSGPSVTLVKFD